VDENTAVFGNDLAFFGKEKNESVSDAVKIESGLEAKRSYVDIVGNDDCSQQ
jgi:hypothetical protein